MKNSLICLFFSIFLCINVNSVAGVASEKQAKAITQGVTEITANFGRTRILVRITTHEVNIGKPSDPWPEKRLTSCTYSRYPCSPVDYLEIFVDGKELFVPRSVFADLSDVVEMSLKKENGLFLLALNGGDASESYTLKIFFNRHVISKRIFISNEGGEVTEETVYFAPKTTLD